MPQKFYLAGPEAFLANAIDIGVRKKTMCERYGFVGLFPLHNEIVDPPSDERLDRAIYAADLALMRKADIGKMLGLGNPVFGYTNHCDDLLTRTGAACTVIPREKGYFDEQGLFVEDFGNSDSLMIDASLALAAAQY